MRTIADLCNGTMRRCRKCDKVLPLCEFTQVPRRHICKLCKSRQWKPKSRAGGKVTWEELLMRRMQWDSKQIYRVGHRLRVTDIVNLPRAVEPGDLESRIVPIDYRTCFSVHNAVVVNDHVGKLLRNTYRAGNFQLYQHILSFHYKDACKPVELIME